MKKITRFSLFWKIYLTLLLVLFLPIILFTLFHIVQSRGETMPLKIVRHLEWSASELAEQAESIAPELLTPWLEHVKEASGLTVCIQRDGQNFYLPGSRWIVSYEPNDEPSPPGPIVVASFSPSERTKAIVTPHSFGEDDARPNPRKRSFWVFLLMAALCVIFSFMLVRNFMNPLLELRRTTLKLAGGDLSVRVGQA
ncbi:MAG: hypothetical protein LBL51_01940, partial [Synergistaceae bacterium]|nr:hypothetical protein [Synergistaceae bacterium]